MPPMESSFVTDFERDLKDILRAAEIALPLRHQAN